MTQKSEPRNPSFFKKRRIQIIIALFLIFIFKNKLYKWAVHYHEIRLRENIVIENQRLKKDLDLWSKNHKSPTLEQIINFSYSYSVEKADYTFQQCSTNPNVILDTKKTNCIGYSAMMHSVTQYLLEKHGFNQIKNEHKVGQLYLFGYNVHTLFSHPSFRDHDYNVITDKATGQKYGIDPTFGAYFGIREVVEK
jgi:exopolyphosphatase/pppGpp-phosphohydrolase